MAQTTAACTALAARLDGADGFGIVTVTANGYVRADVRLDRIITEKAVMEAVLAGGVPSDTPDAPLLLRACDLDPFRFELADGHHRVAQALRDGRGWLTSDIDPFVDEEPYEGVFYQFPAA